MEIPLDPLPLNIYSDDPRLTSDGLGIEAQLQHRHSRSLEAQGIDTGTFYTRAGSRTVSEQPLRDLALERIDTDLGAFLFFR